MPSQNLLQSVGGQAQKPTHFVSLFTSRFLTGYYPNRNLLRGPLQALYSEYYHMGATDALCDGLNSELSIRQTMIRRPGNTRWCSVQVPEAVDKFYSFHESNGDIQPIVDTADVVYHATTTTLTNIFTKNAAAGAGESYFQGVDTSLYITDGVDSVKYIPSGPGNINPRDGSQVWNFGGAAPTVAPIIGTVISTGVGSTGGFPGWLPKTMYSTMGLISDGTNIHQLVSSSGTNPLYGNTGDGAPAFPTQETSTVTESAGTPIVWTCYGPIVAWATNTAFNNASSPNSNNDPCMIYDPITKACYWQGANSARTSSLSSHRPNFTPAIGWNQIENGSSGGGAQCHWFYLGTPKVPPAWQAGHAYAVGSNNDGAASVSFPVDPITAGIGTTNEQASYWMFATTPGTSAPAGSYQPVWATSSGDPSTTDGDLQWRFLSSKTRTPGMTAIAWGPSADVFTVFIDPNGNFQVCISSTGPCSATATASITWSQIYGQPTLDGVTSGSGTFTGVTWTCVGPATTWVAATTWYIPTQGWVPPQPSQPYGGAVIQDTNNHLQYVVKSAVSSNPGPPTWSTTPGNYTNDGVTAQWLYVPQSTFTTAGFTWTTGFGYVYCFKARTSTDVDVNTAPPLATDFTGNPNLVGPLGLPTGSGDGTVTTASPLATLVGPNTTGGVIPITLTGSTDPQFDTISVFRSADGFYNSGPYLFLTDVAMPPLKGTLPGTVTIYDFMSDLASTLNGAQLPGLDVLETAPIDHANDPPPGSYGSTQFIASSLSTPTIPSAGTSMIGQVFHDGRLWGFIGSTVFASGGPDTTVGNGMTAWPPAYEFPFDSNVVMLLPTAAALIVFLTTDVWIIAGGTAIGSYYGQLLCPGIGILSPDAVTLVLGLPHVFTSDRQLISIDPSGGWTRVGHPVGDKIVAYDPSLTYLAYHSYGDEDHGLFIANGSSEWYRCDPNPTPDSQLTGPIWSPKATILDGFKAIAEVDVAAGQKKLLIGPASAGYILSRDSTYTTFQDNGSPYSSYFTMGSIVLAHPGQMAALAFIEGDYIQIGSQPKVSVLLDELSATNGAQFETISDYIVSDPPKLYGETGTPATMWMNRYNFGQTVVENGGDDTPMPAWCKHLQIKVDFGSTDTVQNEMLSFSIFGALYQEK